MLQKIRAWLPALAAFLWPFVYFYKFIVPFAGVYSGIGNDFSTVYYPSKPYLLDWLVHVRMPLWSPTEAAGYPFYSSPIAQVFYPLNLALAIFYRLAGGFTLLDYQVYTILGIAIFALGLYFWLKTFGLNWRAILFAVLCFSVSFKVAETARFANSIQEAAWYPWILYGLTRIFQANSKKRAYAYGLLLFFFMYCLFTAGYPYFSRKARPSLGCSLAVLQEFLHRHPDRDDHADHIPSQKGAERWWQAGGDAESRHFPQSAGGVGSIR